jgi:hypothetical protein
MSGIRRQVGTDQLRRAAPLELVLIDTATLAGQRDRALLLLGFAAALRRSELVALDVEDLEFDTARGLKLTIRKSKTDQQQAGAQVAVPYAPETDRYAVRALSQWLQAAKIHRGPVFRRMRRGDTVGAERLTDQSVALFEPRARWSRVLPRSRLTPADGFCADGSAPVQRRRRHASTARQRRCHRPRQRPYEPLNRSSRRPMGHAPQIRRQANSAAVSASRRAGDRRPAPKTLKHQKPPGKTRLAVSSRHPRNTSGFTQFRQSRRVPRRDRRQPLSAK